MPVQQARTTTRQDYGTPWPFIHAIEKRFGPIAFDLAASHENTKAPRYFTEAEDSLAQDWTKLEGLLFLNPPFKVLDPWAKKCAESASIRTRIILLTPASIATDWWWKWVRPHAVVYAIQRITFEGETAGYPKDLQIAVFGMGATGLGRWRWKDQA